LIVEQGWRLVTGGLGGVMEAASRGAHTAACYREGDVVGVLPSGDPSTANPYVDIAVPTNLGIARNVLVVSMADAVIAVAGGAGTLSEIALAWQLGRVVVGLAVGGWGERVAGHALDDKRPDVVIAARSAEDAIEAIKAAL
jgi:uncharacterized protein (TIGR00725 family)